jgi:hypothetical protein
MARTPFKLRSGNTSSFKNLGSSPAKQKKDIPSGESNPPKGDDDITSVRANYPGPETGGGNNSSDTDASTVVKPKEKKSTTQTNTLDAEAKKETTKKTTTRPGFAAGASGRILKKLNRENLAGKKKEDKTKGTLSKFYSTLTGGLLGD